MPDDYFKGVRDIAQKIQGAFKSDPPPEPKPEKRDLHIQRYIYKPSTPEPPKPVAKKAVKKRPTKR